MIYKQMGTFLERCIIGFTEADYKIQPRAIPHSKSVSPVFVYLSVNRFFLIAYIEKGNIIDGKKRIFLSFGNHNR